MIFNNPNFVAKANNIFTIRRKEYDSLIVDIKTILKPVEEIGFTVDVCEFRDPKFASGELQKTIKKNLVIKMQRGTSNIDLSMQIPKLIDGNYIIINGRKKIPLFQLFDIPIVTRGESIKLRTNVATMMLEERKEAPYIYLSVLGKKVPMFLIMFAIHEPDALKVRFKLDKPLPDPNTMYGKFLCDLRDFHQSIEHDFNREDIVKDIGKIYSKYNYKDKGESILYALDLMLKVDVKSAPLFNTDSIINELIYAMHAESLDDTDFQNKRIRCFEYMILGKVSKMVFDLCIANRTGKNAKFNVNSTQILSECNVSDIVQFDFSINPIDELTKLSRTSLVGPGGFKRDNVPEHLRDISDSMFGRMCSVDTPDRDNCGVLQNLLVNTKLNKHLKFTKATCDAAPISIPVSMVPFLEHDDQTRLQMASSQMRQAIMLKQFDQPMVQSGCEGLYSDQTQFVKRAKKKGEVVFLNDKYLIALYHDKTVDIFDIEYRKIYVENMDMFNIYVKQGDKFKAGEILAESNYCEDGKINIGKNLLTAVGVYYGYNYEDGIAISDRLVKDGGFTSVHYRDFSFTIPPDKVLKSLSEDEYKPLPKVFDRLDVADPYAIMKKIPSGPIDYCSIFEEPIELTTKKPVVITDVKIYPNVWNEDIPEFKNWIESQMEIQKKQEKEIQSALTQYLSKDAAKNFIKDNGLDLFNSTPEYKIKKEKVNGVHIEMFGVYTRKIAVGDKIGNRHGNKGVISTIVPHERMPQLEDGRHVDICINPLGIISRMNIGQLFELHLGMALDDLRRQCKDMLKAKKKQPEIKKFICGFIKLVDNTVDQWYYKQFEKQVPRIIDESFLDAMIVLQPPFESVTAAKMEDIMEYTNTSDVYKMFDPVSNRDFLKPLAVGFMYFFRMVHIAESRLAARGIGSYTRRTLQPLAGRKNRGGQRCGEMETACLIAYDAPVNLSEILTTKSDCIDLKNRYIRGMIETDLVKEEQDDSIVAESVKLLRSYLYTIGVDPE